MAQEDVCLNRELETQVTRDPENPQISKGKRATGPRLTLALHLSPTAIGMALEFYLRQFHLYGVLDKPGRYTCQILPRASALEQDFHMQEAKPPPLTRYHHLHVPSPPCTANFWKA